MRRSALGALAAGAMLLAAAALPSSAVGDEQDGETPSPGREPTVELTIDIHSEIPSSGWSPRGRMTSSVEGVAHGGDSATSEEVDPDEAAEVEKSLEDLGAERTPDGLVVTLPETVLFEFDSAELIGDASEVIENTAPILEYYSDVEVEVRGHTDSIGDDEYNQKLSEDRAAAVRDALIDAGAPSAQLEAVGFGADVPVAPNTTPDGEDDPEGRALNRRVEIVLKDSA